MRNETIALIFGILMIVMGYEITSSGYLFFRGVYLLYGDSTKYVGPLFILIGCISICFSSVLWMQNKKK